MQANHKAWLSDPLEQLDAEAVEKEVQGAYKVLYKMTKASCLLAVLVRTACLLALHVSWEP